MRKVFIIFILFAFVSCTSQEEKQARKMLEELELNQANHLYLIIPNSGCGGCISDAENFAIRNLDNPNLKVIFTAFSSKKNLRIHLGERFYHPNTVIDSNSYVKRNGLLSIYLIAILMKDGEVKKQIEFSPKTKDVFFECSNFLGSLK